MSVEELANNNVLVLRAMGYMCNNRPSKVMLADFKLAWWDRYDKVEAEAESSIRIGRLNEFEGPSEPSILGIQDA